LSIAEHGADEFHLRIVSGGLFALLRHRRTALTGQLAENLQRVLAGKQAEHHHAGDAAQPQPTAKAHAAAASGIHYVVAATSPVPAHGGVSSVGRLPASDRLD